MKIGLVIYGSLNTVSGGYYYDRKLVEYLQGQGDTVDVFTLPWRNYPIHLTDNFYFRLPQNLDVLIQDELNHPSLIRANLGRHPYPILSLVHHLRCSELRSNWQNSFYRVVEKKYLKSVDGFIFNSRTTKGVVNGLAGDDKPSIVAYPPTDRLGEAIPQSEIDERSNAGELRIAFVGNVTFRKGLHTLLKAIKDLTPSVKVDVIGGMNVEPGYACEMERYVLLNGLGETVNFHGVLDREKLMALLNDAHIMVVPSSYEGFGIVYLEGMCFGLPAIGTTEGAAGEIITHGEDGYLIQPKDSEALTNIIDKLARNRDLLRELSFNAVKRYKSQPKWEDTARSIREFLYKMADDSPVIQSATFRAHGQREK